MRKHFISVNLLTTNQIEVLYYLEDIDINSLSFYLKDKDGNKISLNKQVRIDRNIANITLGSDKEIELGKDYKLFTSDGESSYIDYEEFTSSPFFDQEYAYDGDDLGANYSKKQTVFKLYSPLAAKAYLKIEKKDNTFVLFEMKREEKGVYSTTINGDLLGKKYLYLITINGEEKSLRDPYGKGVSLNSEYSAVVDINEVLALGTVAPKRKLEGLKDEVIYEVNIRDFTEEISSKATYSEFIKKIPYLKSLGISRVQLLPVLDFDNVDDILLDTYNWGYDPLSFFALEGSYSEFPENAMSRLLEFKNLVNELHKADIRVILDVVYNHVYEHMTSDWEKSFPNYYFRKYRNRVCNASGCGNDFASEKTMARKMIVDSVKYLLKTFDVDGFRFDLLGLIDIETTKEIVRVAKEIKPDVLIYGEGWDMATNLPSKNKTSTNNASQVPEVAFFNAEFRDTLRGNNFDLSSRGFASGASGLRAETENVLLGSCLNSNFVDASQSINYVECHDNHTLADKFAPFYDQEELLRRVKFANSLTILSLGRPLIHMGQEIALSKFGLDNTYNVKKVNNMSWELVEERSGMVDYLRDLIKLRNKYDIFNLTDKNEISDTFDIYQYENGLMTLKVKNPKYMYGYKDLIFVINPTDKDLTIDLNDYYEVLFTSHGFAKMEIIVKNLIASHSTLRILGRK